MKSIKLIITHKAQLAKKYDAAQLKNIAKAIKALIAKDKGRGVDTHFLHLDQSAEMAKYGVKHVDGAVTPNKCKVAIDALFTALSPDYLVLLGAGDVIPFFDVPNPSYSPVDGDDDELVPTDNPYASSRPYVKSNRKSYLVPDRVIGRIPDLPGDHPDVNWLLDYLSKVQDWKPEARKVLDGDLLVCCDTWKKAGLECVAHVSKKADRLMISPPIMTTAQGALSSRYRTRFHMIKCHGAPSDGHFYGQKGNSYPEVIHSKVLKGKTTKGSVVGAMCCYGASLFDPTDPGVTNPGDVPIPSLYLRQGAFGFFGSTTVAWVGDQSMLCADWIISGALKCVSEGASLGRAMLDSKQKFVEWIQKEGMTPDTADEKSLLQFLLLGDPSIHVVSSVSTTEVVPAGLRLAAGFGPTGSAQERRVRRTNAHRTGQQLRSTLPKRQIVNKMPAKVKKALASICKHKNFQEFKIGKPIVHEVTQPLIQPELSSAAVSRVTASFSTRSQPIAQKETFEYYLFARKETSNKGIVDARMLKIETDHDGTILRTRVLVSS